MKTKGKRNLTVGGFGGFMIGVGSSVLSVVLCSFAAAALASASDDPVGVSGLYSLLALILSGAISGFIISRSFGDGGVKRAALCSLTTVELMLLAAIIITMGAPRLSALMNYACFMGVSILAAFFGRKRERRHRIKKRR